jgi:hypothetical protein
LRCISPPIGETEDGRLILKTFDKLLTQALSRAVAAGQAVYETQELRHFVRHAGELRHFGGVRHAGGYQTFSAATDIFL